MECDPFHGRCLLWMIAEQQITSSGFHTGFFSGGGKFWCAWRTKNFTLDILKYTFYAEMSE